MITVGVIGAGRIGQLHIDNLALVPSIKVKSVADVYIDNIYDWAQQRNIVNITKEPMDIIHDPEIDAILICSPTTTHMELIKAAARAKKHIFCEKPITFSSESTQQALAVVKEEGVKLQVGFNRRFDTNFRTIRNQIANGVIGAAHTLRITSRDPQPPPIEYVKTSGGLFMDMMIHDFDMARYVMQSEVVEVHAKGAVLIDEKIGEVGDVDTAIVLLTFANGSIGTIENSRKAVYGYDQRLEVFGEKGALVIENNRPSNVTFLGEEGVLTDKPYHFFLERYTQAYIDEIKEFATAITNNTEILCTGNDGLQAERIAEAAKKSMQTGQPVVISK
ncbi:MULTISPECIES: inositol 2-dehydrogenase [unclassified Lysinibacillus]|uniref:inositol 2-dehydrogenase n=1 Tax=unclassified Lysinibacillus TaxID=2636778 RepID=UPI0038128637